MASYNEIYDGLAFIDLLREPIIKKDYITEIEEIADAIGDMNENYYYKLGMLMNRVFHCFGLSITKWENDNVIYFTLPSSYDSNTFSIFTNPIEIAKLFKVFMNWCLAHGAGTTEEWTNIYGKITPFTYKYKIRENECWNKVLYLTSKIAINTAL